MKTFIFVYEGCALYEVVFSALLCSYSSHVATVGLTRDKVVTSEGIGVVPDLSVNDLNAFGADQLVIPGGSPETACHDSRIVGLIQRLDMAGNTIAAICAGPFFLAVAGIMDKRRYTVSRDRAFSKEFEGGVFVDRDIVRDENIITAQGSSYLELAMLLAKETGAFDGEEDERVTYMTLKNTLYEGDYPVP